MNTLRGWRVFFTLVCLSLMLVLTLGNVKANLALQAESHFAAIDVYIETQRQALGIPGMALGIVQNGQITMPVSTRNAYGLAPRPRRCGSRMVGALRAACAGGRKCAGARG